jgi:histidinol phosphatase-like enzyme
MAGIECCILRHYRDNSCRKNHKIIITYLGDDRNYEINDKKKMFKEVIATVSHFIHFTDLFFAVFAFNKTFCKPRTTGKTISPNNVPVIL